MGYSKKWLALTPEQRKVKRKEYNDRYKTKYPERITEQKISYKKRHKDILRTKNSKRQKETTRKHKIQAIEYLGGSCFDCKGKFIPACYDFHHLDPSIKDKEIAKLMSRSFENIKIELDKCVLLCANCHRIRHAKENE